MIMNQGLLTMFRMLRRLGSFAAWYLFLLLIMCTPASATQTITAHDNISLTATASDFDAEEKVSSENQISWVYTDGNWKITVKSLDANLGSSGGYTKPLSDLMWQLSVGGSWTSMTTEDATVKTGSSGSGSIDVDYKFLLSWSLDIAGNYGATLQYTISSQ